MRAVIQRVFQAHVSVNDEIIGQIEKGLVVLLAIHITDTEKPIPWMVDKLLHLRLFADKKGRMNLNLKEVHGEILVISQFTLYGNCYKGRRPSFIESAEEEKAKNLYEAFCSALKKEVPMATGKFGAFMQVHLINDGPVTLILDSPSSN